MITKESTGTSAKELIDKFAITELKLLLKSTSTPLKEIAAQLNYPGEAFLCKYFKKHTGTTPSHFRNTSK
jgi:YesN/AraC family two-component response regulator